MLRPMTDTARKVLLDTLVHGVVSLSVIGCATFLAAVDRLSETSWTAAVGAGIAASGAISVLQAKVGNGSIADEAAGQRVGGRRRRDPPAEPAED